MYHCLVLSSLPSMVRCPCSELREEEVDRLVEDDVAAPEVDREDDGGHDHDDGGADHFRCGRPGDLLHLAVGVAEEVAGGEPPLARLRHDRVVFSLHYLSGHWIFSDRAECACSARASFRSCVRRALFTSFGRPRGTRTPNLRFWRPLLCQLSYWPANRRKSVESYSLHGEIPCPISSPDGPCASARDGRTSSARASPSSSSCSSSSSSSAVCTRCIGA